MMNSNVSQELMITNAWPKSLALLVLVGALVLGNAPSVNAGKMHARSVIGAGIANSIAPHGGVAHAVRSQGTKWRTSHEEFGNNYTHGNAGIGHAHHHGHSPEATSGGEQENSNAKGREPAPPVLGSKGTSQYVRQTWLPNATGDKIDVAWSPESFLQVDPSELTPGSRLVSRASLAILGGLSGTVELSAQLDEKRKAKIETKLTGIFKGLKFELVTHPGGVVSLQFQQPLKWTVTGKAETFDIALDASIDDGSKQ